MVLVFVKPVPGAMGVSIGLTIALYALAKVFEHFDAQVYTLTGEVLSGHSLKHVLAAGAAWPVMTALGSLVALRHSDATAMPLVMPSGQNGAHAVGVARRSGA